MKRFFQLLTACFIFAITTSVSRGAGVTVITHGFNLTPGFPGWVDGMAQAITNAAYQRGLSSSWYHIYIHGDIVSGYTATMSRISDATADNTAEVVVTVDWSDIADNLNLISGSAIRTDYVASWISGALLTAYPGLGMNTPLAARPIHLIGHSRGASVMTETARMLGAYGVWVDHLTTLDPHPLAFPDPGIMPGDGDPAAILYDNVVFADNYWRSPEYPSGESIAGSEDISLDDSKFGITDPPHSDVHSWYHGTIDAGGIYPANDGLNGIGGANIPDSWYSTPNPARNLGGFFYTRIENNFMHYRPAFSYAIGQAFGGHAQRATTSRAGGTQWANIGQIHIPAYPNNKFTQGDNLTVTYQYQDRDSGVRIEWYIDSDSNPYNNSSNPIFVQTLDATGDKVANGSATISTAGLTTGVYRKLFAKIISLNNSTVRYDYSDNQFTVVQPAFALTSVTPAQVVTGAGVTHLTLTGNAFNQNCMVRLNNGLTTTEIAPTSFTATQILADFDFGATARSWDVTVREYLPAGTLPGQTEPAPLQDTAIVQVNVSATVAGPTITLQPADASISYGQTSTFSVAANGSGTLTYKWQRNGQDISGATNTSYTTSPVTSANDGFTYQVFVSDANGTTVSRLATLNVVSQISSCNDPMEPNDHSYQATILPLGVVTNGLICSPSDVDWFKVTLVTNGLLNLSLVVPSGLDFDLELYGTDLAWVAGSYKAAGQNESIQQTLAAGDYYVRVYGYPAGNGSYSQTLPYQLSANAAEVRPPGPLSGYITNDVSWSGVVQITGDITIASGGSLKIMPGTQIRCSGGDDRTSGIDNNRIEIILNGGKLDATGSADAPIRFTSSAQNPQPGNWYGLRIIEGDVTMSYCTVEYAVDGIRFEDTDTRFNNYALGNVTVQRCSNRGIYVTGGQYASVTLNNFLMWTNSTGLQSDGGPVTLTGGQVTGNTGNGINMNGTLTASGTLISQNAGAGISGGTMALTSCAVSQNGSTGVSVNNGTLTSCMVTGNHGDGVYANGAMQMSGCTLFRNNGWGLNEYAGNNGSVPVEVWNNLVQSNGSGGLNLYYHAMVGVVNNTISGNSGNGMNLSLYSDNWGSGGVSASGITGNAIYNNGGVGVDVNSSQPAVLTISGNDIYQNTGYELRNDGGIVVIANGNYWSNPTGTELSQGQKNLSRIYDILDGGSAEVLITSWYTNPLSGGSPGPLQSFSYSYGGGAMLVTGGTYNSAQTWSGTVLVVGDVTITGSLTIMPGTTVMFDALHDSQASGNDRSRCELIIGGSLNAVGTTGSPILFTSAAQNKHPADWYGIRVAQGDVMISNCVVEYAVDGIRFENTDTRFNNYALGNVTVQRCSNRGVYETGGQYASVMLNNFQMWTNSTGLQSDGGAVMLTGGLVTGNTGNGINMNGTLTATGATISQNAGVGISGGTMALTSCVVSQNGSTGASVNGGNFAGCMVTGNHGDGIYANGTLQMNGCTLSRNNGWGLNEYAGNNGSVPVEVWNNLVQSNGSGGLNLYYHAVVGVVSNTISGNTGNGMNLSLYSDNWGSGGVSASGITGNAIYNNGGVGVEVQSSQPAVLTISGNDIYQNSGFELRNDSGIVVIANGNYWSNPTGTELSQGQKNLSRIYDILDGGSAEVVIANWYAGTFGGGNPGPLQNFAYTVPGGVTQVVSGTYNTAQTWSGTVFVVGDVTVSGGLTIAAGTKVLFDALHDNQASGSDRSRCELIINGSLNATGDSGNPIVFTSAAQNKHPADWYGIRVVQGDVTMTNCVVEYAVDGIRFENTDTRFNSYALGNVTVQRCSSRGVYVTGGQYASVTLNNFQMWTNSTGLQSDGGPVTLMWGQVTGNTGNGINMNGTLTATGATISQNAGAGISGGTMALTSCAVSQNGSTGVSVNGGTLTSCLVTGNHGDGVYANGALQMNGCTLSHNNGWGLNEYAGNNGSVPVEVWNNLVQSNGSGGLNLYYHAMVGVVNNTISGNSGNGMNLSLYSDNWGSGGVSASGITGNAIYNNGGVGVEVQGNQPPVLTVSGNDIYQNTSFEFRNDSGISVVAPANYWGEPTTTEWTMGLVNLTRIYDQRDNPSSGQVLIQSIRGTPALQAPHFTSQPQPVTALPGDTITLSASADGTAPISYQWYRNNSTISQATSNVLTLPNLVANNAGNYYLVAANAAGVATSLVAQVTVILPPSPPVIVQHPVSQTVGLGASVSFAVAATGTGPFTYQWNKNNAPISGANAATFSISSVLVSDAADYTVTVSNAGGNSTSQPATLTVNTLGGSVVSRQITRIGTNFLVTVTVVPPIATPAYLVEEFVPTNFTVLNVSSYGSLDTANGRIVWGVFWDGLTRTLSYTLVPPPGFTGTTTLNGSALFFGATATTGGDNQITVVPPQNSSTLGIAQWYGFYVITINGTVGSSYRLDAATNLLAGPWESLGIFTLPRTPYSVVDWDSPSIPNRFYRTVLIQ